MQKPKIIKEIKSGNGRGNVYLVKCLECGKTRKIWNSELKKGKGAYCSIKCKSKHHIQPPHTQTTKDKISNSRLKRKEEIGYLNSEETRKKLSKTYFKKGRIPFNKGLKAGNSELYQNRSWSAHEWIKKRRGLALKYVCEICNKKPALHWSNKNHQYKKRYNDWQALCVSCHGLYDSKYNNKYNYDNPKIHLT